MKNLQYHLTGIVPVIPHNGDLASPLNKFSQESKKISSKRKKVDADYLEMARLEFLGGLYVQDGRPIIPAKCLEAMLIGKGGSARKEKMGVQAAPALFIPDDCLLIYEGPTDPVKLWESGEFTFQSLVRVGQAKIMRTRPMFREWELDVLISYEPDLLEEQAIDRWMDVGGSIIGLCDWRPRYGRFSVERVF